MGNTSLEWIARRADICRRGIITAQEFATALSDTLAHDNQFDVQDADRVAALIPPAALELVKKQVDVALSPGYMRGPFFGGRPRTKEEELAEVRQQTTREQLWSAALKPLLDGIDNQPNRPPVG